MLRIDQNGLLVSCESSAETIFIPEGVTTIGKGAFQKNTDLCCIIFPDSLKTIGDFAFEGCRSLRQVGLRNGIKRLGNGCFKDCASLRAIELPETAISIHANAFESCSALREVRLSGMMTRNIESRAFAECRSLKRIVIPAGIRQIKRGAFHACAALEEVIFQNEVVLIDRTAFEGCDALNEQTLAFIHARVMRDDTVDINSRAAGSAGRLSNYTERHFILDGVECHSVEGVLRSLKCPDTEVQKGICLLTGGWAKKAGGQYDWRTDQTLYWKGKPYLRRSEEYGKLLDRLYDAVFEQDASFRNDLASLQDRKIDHRMGLTNPAETVLTRMEFVRELQRLIDKTL